MARAVRLVFCLLLPITLAPSLSAQSSIRYIYDALGRLVGVIDASGDAAEYHYDAVGNLLSITRSSATQVNIIDFCARLWPDRSSRHDPRNRIQRDTRVEHGDVQRHVGDGECVDDYKPHRYRSIRRDHRHDICYEP